MPGKQVPGFQAHFQGGVRGSPGTGLLPLEMKSVTDKLRQVKSTVKLTSDSTWFMNHALIKERYQN